MTHLQPAQSHSSRQRSAAVIILGISLGSAGCDMPGQNVASFTQQAPPSDESRLRPYAEVLAERYAANPDDKTTALRYASALRRLTQHAQAVAVLQRLAVKQPRDMEILSAYGKALADAGRLQEAQSVLARSHTPDRPDWTILSAQGSVSDQLGDHAGAQAYYNTALKIVPNQPQVLSNLGLSYALEHRLPEAETTLRKAAAQPTADMRVRQNLAMVLTVEGKTQEAEDVSRRDLSAMDAAENVTTIQRTVAQSDTWRTVGRPATKMATGRTPAPTRTAANSADQ